MDLKNFFVCALLNLTNDNIISALWPGLKTGIVFRDLVCKRGWKITFFGLKSGQDLENRAHTPTKNSQE